MGEAEGQGEVGVHACDVETESLRIEPVSRRGIEELVVRQWLRLHFSMEAEDLGYGGRATYCAPGLM